MQVNENLFLSWEEAYAKDYGANSPDDISPSPDS
jgi:hypothetical protein